MSENRISEAEDRIAVRARFAAEREARAARAFELNENRIALSAAGLDPQTTWIDASIYPPEPRKEVQVACFDFDTPCIRVAYLESEQWCFVGGKSRPTGKVIYWRELPPFPTKGLLRKADGGSAGYLVRVRRFLGRFFDRHPTAVFLTLLTFGALFIFASGLFRGVDPGGAAIGVGLIGAAIVWFRKRG